MSEHDGCPGADLLARLAQGALAATEQESLARHVERCADCQQALARLTGSHGSRLRSEDTGTHPEQPTLFQTRSLRTRGVAAEPDAPTPTPQPTPRPVPEPPPFPFLGPSTRAGTLGRLGSYEIIKLLGQGGMGIVFLAEDDELGRTVAVKVMRPDLARDPFARQRFVREARATAAISSPHIATIFRVGQDNDIPYLAMEYLQGEPLDRWLERARRLSPGQAVRLGRGIAAGLAAAHEAGLVHRDIKPANIWIETRTLPPTPGNSTPATSATVVKILDFGLARSAQDNLNLTQSGLVVGTPAYMAPEQADGAPVDARSDLFSLGCVLYRLCTGQAPFTGPTVMAVLKSIALREPTPPRELNPAVPPALSDLIVWLLAKNPARRPGTARQVEEMLATIEKDLLAAGEPVSLSAVELAAPRSLPATPVPDARSAIYGSASDSNPTDPAVRTGERSSNTLRLADPSPRRRHLGAIVLIVLGLALGGVATALLLRPGQEKSTLEVRSDVAGVRVLVERDGRCVAVLDPVSKATAALPSGEYALRVEGDGDGLEVSPASVHLSGGEPIVVRVRQRKPSEPDPEEKWRLSVAQMAAPAQIDAVTARLRERNPEFTGKPEFDVADGAVIRVRLSAEDVSDLSPLRALPKLQAVSCFDLSGMGRLSDLTPLRGLPLRSVHIAGDEVRDLTPLKNMPLEQLIFMYNPVRSIEPLRGMPLKILSFRGAQVRDLGPVKGMPLRHLNLSHNPVADLSPLAGSSVTELVCQYVPVRDLSPLKGLKLRLLEIQGTAVEDLSVLKELPLKEVIVDVRSPADLDVLKAIPGLEKINHQPTAEFLAKMEHDFAELKEADEAVTAPPADAAACVRLARVLEKFGRRSRAETLLGQALARQGEVPELLQERGRLYALAARWPLAAGDFRKAWERRPEQFQLAQAAAYLFLEAGNRDAYRQICERLLKEHGNTQDGFAAGVIALTTCQDPAAGSPDTVVRLAELAAKNQAGTGVWQTALGTALYRAGKYDAARTVLEAALPTAPRNTAWGLSDYLVLAMVQQRLGNTARARRYFDRATHAYDKQLMLRPTGAFVPMTDEYWWDTISFLLLRREAEKLLSAKTAGK